MTLSTTDPASQHSSSLQHLLIGLAVVGSVFQWQELSRVAGLAVRPSLVLLCAAIGVYFVIGSLSTLNAHFALIVPRSIAGVSFATVGITFATIAFGTSLISLTAVFEMGINAILASLFGIMVAVEVSRPEGPRFSGLAVFCTLSLVAALFVPVFLQGGNPISTISQGIRTGDSEVIQFGLFRAAFRSSASTEEVQANVRHSITVIVLMAFYLSLISSTQESRGSRILRKVGALMAAIWLILSLSRTSWLAAAVPGLVFVLQRANLAFRQGRIRAWQALTVVVGLVVIQPASTLLIDRFTNTASYEGRTALARASFDALGDRLLFGGPTAELRPHNMILSFWLAGGVLAAFGAALIAAEAGKLAIDGARTALAGGGSVDGLLYAQIGLSSTAFVRMFTSGGFTMHLASWLALGAAGGISTARRLRSPEADLAARRTPPREETIRT